MVHVLPYLRKRRLFLWPDYLNTSLAACIFSWLLFEVTYPEQTCGFSTLHCVFQDTELFLSTAELAVACCCFCGTVMHPWRAREAIFVLCVGNKILSITVGCGMEGERIFLLSLFLFLCCWSQSIILVILGCSWKYIAPDQQQKTLWRPLSGLQTSVMMKWWQWCKLPLIFKIVVENLCYSLLFSSCKLFSSCNWNC